MHRLFGVNLKGMSLVQGLSGQTPSSLTGWFDAPAYQDAFFAPDNLDAERNGQSHGRWYCTS